MSEEPSWDEKASKAAFPVLLKESQRMHAARERPSVQGPFMAAAGWQRDQLRTDEAVERVAREIYTETTARDPWPHSWETADEFARGACIERARTAITALLGED